MAYPKESFNLYEHRNSGVRDRQNWFHLPQNKYQRTCK